MVSLKKIYLPLGYLLMSLAAVFAVANVSASTVVFSSTGNNGAKLVASSNVDMLIPSMPNSDGNSYTKLTSFVIDRPLKIINSPGTHATSGPLAKLIIIDATSANLRSNIEIVGETADLLIFVNSNTANLSCTNCSFANIGRATLAAAAVSFNSLNNPVTISPVNSSLIINGLSTERVASMELIGRNIILNGRVNTQTRGSRLSDGSYQVNPNGGLIVGAGGVNIFSGFVMSYPDLQVGGAPYATSSLSMNSSTTISSQAIHIATAKPFRLLGTVTTKSDVTTAANYRGKLSAVEEAINIYSLGTSGALSVEGALYSDKLVDVRSASDLTLNGVVNAAGLIAIAGEGKKLMHGATGSMILPGRAAKWLVTRENNKDMVGLAECREKPLKADGAIDEAKAYLCLSAFLSGGSVENNGSIKGRNVVVAAIGDLQNRYSGRIVADNIQLSSQQGFIRNGSQYPFRPLADSPKFLTPIDPNNIPLGTVTINDQLFLSAQNGAQKVDTSAFIIGKNVILSASGNIENINPYLELTTDTELWRNGVVFSPVKSARVQIIAEDNLKIESRSYILNSSAYIGVSKPGGIFYASAPSIANQRYTAQAVVKPFNRDDVNSVNNTGLEAALMTYSPQGAIYSFAHLHFQLGTLGSFVNNSSYFEVLNSAKIGSPSDPAKESNLPPETSRSKVINIGLNVNSVVNTSVNTQYVSCLYSFTGSGEAASRNHHSECQRLYGSIPTVAPGTQIEAQQGTLFSVKGSYDSTSHLQVTNHDVMAKMKDDVIANYIQAQSKASGSGIKTAPNGVGGYISYSYVMGTGLSADKTSIITAPRITSDNSRCTHSEAFCKGGVTASDVGQPTIVKNIAQLLEETFKQMKDFLIQCINALKSLLS